MKRLRSMSETRKAYKFKLKPNRSQVQQFEQFCGNTRFVYNALLAWSSDTYKETGQNTVGRSPMCSKITSLKKEHEWLKRSHVHTLQSAADDLISAYQRFFKGLGGYPRFKSKKRHRSSFRYKSGVKIQGSKIYLPKIGWVSFRKSQEVQGQIKTATVSQSPSGWFVSISCIVDVDPLPVVEHEVGIDLGLTHFATLSTGEQIDNPKHYRSKERKLRRLSRALSRKMKGSANRSKAKRKLAKHHEKVANTRKDFLHKQSTRLIRENQTIGLEDLNVKGMLKNRRLAKSISDVSWSEFVRQLEYKAAWYGREVFKVGRFFPSSKTTSCCNEYLPDLKLSDRIISCPACGRVWDRDVNAAINILNVAVGHTETQNARGDERKTVMVAAVVEESRIPRL